MTTVGQFGAEALLSSIGSLLPNTAVTVLNMDSTVASLFTDTTGATSGPNPLNTDTRGNLTFYAAPNRYQLSVASVVIGTISLPLELGTGVTIAGAEVVTGAKTWTGSQYILTADRPMTIDGFAGVDPSGATECHGAINAALAGFHGIMEFHPNGSYQVNGTVLLSGASNLTLRGKRNARVSGSSTWTNGPTFYWTGAAGGTILELLNVQACEVDGICCDGASIASVTCLLVDATGNGAPSTQQVTIRNFTAQRYGNGTGSPGFGMRIGQSISNNFQIDGLSIIDPYFDTGDISMSVESFNALDNGSGVSGMRTFGCNIGLRVLGIGVARFVGCQFGGQMFGNNPAYISIGSGPGDTTSGFNPLIFEGCEAEVPWYGTVASASNGATVSSMTSMTMTGIHGSPPSSGTFLVQSSAGCELVAYTGYSAGVFSGTSSSGTGILATGGEVNAGYCIRVNGLADVRNALILRGNTFDGMSDCQATKRIVTEGNNFGSSFFLSGAAAILNPLGGDTFVTSGRSFFATGAGSRVGTNIWVQNQPGTGAPSLMSYFYSAGASYTSSPTTTGSFAGNVGDLLVDTFNAKVWRCTTGGIAGSATWTNP